MRSRTSRHWIPIYTLLVLLLPSVAMANGLVKLVQSVELTFGGGLIGCLVGLLIAIAVGARLGRLLVLTMAVGLLAGLIAGAMFVIGNSSFVFPHNVDIVGALAITALGTGIVGGLVLGLMGAGVRALVRGRTGVGSSLHPFVRRPGWRECLIGALIAVLVAGVVGHWWVGRPERSTGRFISLLRKGQTDQAAAMLREASSIHADPAGNLTIKAKDGTTVTLTQEELPVVAHGPVDPPPRAGIADYVAGRYRFQMSPAGPAAPNARKQTVVVYCVVEANRIVIDTIRDYVKRHGATVWGFVYGGEATGPVGVPGIDYGACAYATVGNDEPAFVIWMVPAVSSLDSMSRGSFGSVIGSFPVGQGRRLDLRFEPRHNKGTVTIAGREYDCADGCLFLIRDGAEVKQLQRDPQQLAGVLKGAISDFARRDSEISSFYGVNTQQDGFGKLP